MAKMYYNGNANEEFLNGKTVAVIGLWFTRSCTFTKHEERE